MSGSSSSGGVGSSSSSSSPYNALPTVLSDSQSDSQYGQHSTHSTYSTSHSTAHSTTHHDFIAFLGTVFYSYGGNGLIFPVQNSMANPRKFVPVRGTMLNGFICFLKGFIF